MSIITIDFETYYSKEFSLSKMTTEEYIRDPQFQIIGVAVKVDDGKTRFFSGSHESLRNQLQDYNWASSMVVAHNAMFDMAILNWILGIKPMAIGDTLSIARAIHGTEVGNSLNKLAQYYKLCEKGTEVVNAINKRREDFSNEEMRKYAGYCANDVEITYQLFLTLLPHFNKTELRLINLTIRMFTEPSLRLDGPVLHSHLTEVRDSKKALLTQSGANVDDLMSNFKFAELLRKLGVEPPMKISPTTGKETLALAKTDEEFKALSEHPDVRVQTQVAARLGNKTTLEETRTERLISIAGRGLIPDLSLIRCAHWTVGGADKLNFQNFLAVDKMQQVKEAILAPAGHVI